MDKNTVTDKISCPFCMSHDFELKPGKVSCPVCFTNFEIDDRGECIFSDSKKVRSPIEGVFCKKCRLVQYEKGEVCLNCGAVMKVSA